MNILLTNDDGIESAGLQTLASVLRRRHSVWISAPDSQRSASSHAITIHDHVTFTRVADQEYSCSGTPADTILYALVGAVPVRPDLVISGINHGMNIGRDIIYSGTVAAAREAAIFGIPAVAVSADLPGLGSEDHIPLEEAASFMLENLEQIIELWEPDTVINVNVPISPIGHGEAAAVSNLSYGNELEVVEKQDNRVSYHLGGSLQRIGDAEEHSDHAKLSRGIISLSAVEIYPKCSRRGMERLEERFAHGR